MGTEGFDWDRGFEVPDNSDAEFKAMSVQPAATVIVMTVESKLGKRFLCRFATRKDVHRVISSHDQERSLPQERGNSNIIWIDMGCYITRP